MAAVRGARFLRRLVLCAGLALLAFTATDVRGSDQPYTNVRPRTTTFVTASLP